MLTDKIATWIKKGFVAGPFEHPPVEGFRANPLAAVKRNGKVRPILNMSGPRGKSYNDNVNEMKMEKVHMSTAKSFSYGLREAGEGAVFSKFDVCDAYKLMPAKPGDFWLQGFAWLGRYFVETQETFGSKASVCNFDRLSNTKDLLVCLNSGTPRKNVYRVIDDTPCVASGETRITKNFSAEMKRLCSFVNIPLAKNCEEKEKAFVCETEGTILGIRFDSKRMQWSMPQKKADRLITLCIEAKVAMHMDLKQVQKLMGSINDMAQLCPIMKFHKGTGNLYLEKFKGKENILIPGTKEFKQDMAVIAKIAESAKTGLPIAARPCKPPLSTLTFYSDAAGASFSMKNKEMVFHKQENRGVACVGGENIAQIWVGGKITWPEKLITEMRDEKGVPYGCKSTFLESVGLLIPFLLCPEELQGRNILFKIDNRAVVHGWEKGIVKNDQTASEVLKCTAYMAGYLGTTVHVEHILRVSDEMTELVDELSRGKKPKCEEKRKIIEDIKYEEVKSELANWLKEPKIDGSLCMKLVREMQEKLM